MRILNFISRCASWIKIRKTVFWTVCMPNHVAIHDLRCASSNHGPEVFSSYASRKSRNKIAVWMPWPLNRVLGGGANCDLLTTSAYIPRAAYVQKHRKCELHACLIGRVPRHSSPSGMQTPKFGRSSLVCTLRNSKFAITLIVCTLRNSKYAFRIKIQNTHFAVMWKHC